MRNRIPLAVLAMAFVLGCSGAPRKPDAFYGPPAPIPDGKPGDVLRLEPTDEGPAGARSWRVLYRSTGMKGEPIAVSALLVVPDGPAPEAGRNVVAWAHPTTGVVPDCAPSLQPGWKRTIPGLDAMVKAGWVVVATDYPGLGTPGVHPYLVGASEARAVVDSVRAARNVKDAGAGKRFVVWGHSQGGHAALFTGQLAPTLAPELELVGVAAAAPATDLAKLLEMDLGTKLGNVLAAEALFAWSKVYDTPLGKVVYPAAIPVVEKVAARCIRDTGEGIAAFTEAMPLRDGFLAVKMTAAEPWATIMKENSTGASPIRAPVFISQGTIDTVVRASVTAMYAGGVCADGTPVHYKAMPDESHILAAFHSADDAVAWMGDRFAGKPAPDDCVRGKN
ncbi:MAG: alpha/beta fold hydrolase [Deltaproteobacteria bacterium]